MNEIIVLTPEQLQTAIRETLQQVIKEQRENIFPAPEKKSYLTRKEVAELLHLSLVSLNKLTQTGKIKALRIGGRVLYNPSDVTEAVKEMAVLKYRRK